MTPANKEKPVRMDSTQKSTRIGFVTNIYTPYKEAMLREIARLVDLKVYYCAEREHDRQWKVEFSEKYNYEILPGTTFNLKGRKLHFNPKLISRIKKDKIDVMIVGEWCNPTVILTPFWLRFKGIPRILWSGSTDLESTSARVVTDPIKRLIVRQYQGYVSYTQRAAAYVQRLGAPKSRITVAPVTVDTDFFFLESNRLKSTIGRDAIRKKFNLAEEDICIAFVGQMIQRKGVDLLIKAIESIGNKRVKVLLAGSGNEQIGFEKLAAKLKVADQFTFLGHFSQQDLIEVYIAADLFTLPSRKEPSGNVINEAMTVGLPVVISDNIGCDCVIEGRNGYVFRSENVDDYVNALKGLIDNKERRVIMGLNAQNDLLNLFSIQREAYFFAFAIEKLHSELDKDFVPIVPIDSYIGKLRSDI